MKPANPREPVLVAEAGVPYRVVPLDPIAAWLDLMEVIEALLPPGSAPLPAAGAHPPQVMAATRPARSAGDPAAEPLPFKALPSAPDT